MHIKRCLRSTIVAAGLILAGASHLILAQETAAEWRRMLKASEAEQTAWINSDLDRGMPTVDPDAGVLTMLILNRSSVTLPLIEQKIEQVLRSPSPLDCFTDKSVDAQKFVGVAAAMIAYAGDEQALREISKLIKIDEKQFGRMVEGALINARSYRNPFIVAYRGFEIGDPAVDSRIAPWVESQFDKAESILRQANTDSEVNQLKRWWAEAMVEKYGRVPTEMEWLTDPLVSRLKPYRAVALHDDIMRLASGVVQKPSKRPVQE
jgi:hypothetical protein